MGDTQEAGPERKRRSKLTLNDRVARVDVIIRTHETKLAAARKRRAQIIEGEAKRAQDALDAVNKARALEQVAMPEVTD